MKTNTRLVAEMLFIKELITKTYPSGLVSVVSDTFDFWSVISVIAKELKPIIEARDGKVVFRPDSGHPTDIICGENGLTIPLEQQINPVCDYNARQKGAVECLWDIYGGTINEKGYKVLNPKVGIIYGDSITIDIANSILKGLEAKGFASSNIVFGIGSYTYNYSTRDSFGMAVKSTYVEIDGVPHDIEKDPKTGDGVKKSAKGLLCVLKDSDDNYTLKDQCTIDEEKGGYLEDVFIDGKLIRDHSLAEIRARL